MIGKPTEINAWIYIAIALVAGGLIIAAVAG